MSPGLLDLMAAHKTGYYIPPRLEFVPETLKSNKKCRSRFFLPTLKFISALRRVTVRLQEKDIERNLWTSFILKNSFVGDVVIANDLGSH